MTRSRFPSPLIILSFFIYFLVWATFASELRPLADIDQGPNPWDQVDGNKSANLLELAVRQSFIDSGYHEPVDDDQSSDMVTSNSTGKLYFGYGSNLSIAQMHSRCPNSHYVGLARLKGWKWIINDRGYANVVELPKGSSASKENQVWGLVFYLTPSDEARLDRNEGVPYAYTKEMLRVDFWRHGLENLNARIDVEGEKSVRKEVLVYVDRKRTTDSKPKEEYIIRMNNGIEDATRFGMPVKYVEEVMRRFIPEPDGEEDEGMVAKAAKQALMFRDEDEPELDGYRDR